MADIRVNRRRAALPLWLWVTLALVLAAAVWVAFVVIGEDPRAADPEGVETPAPDDARLGTAVPPGLPLALTQPFAQR